MRTLGIDYGTRRIGLAMSDDSGRWVTPLDVIPADGAALAHIQRVITREGVCRVVIGYPLNMDGTHGPMATTVKTFAASVFAAVASGTPVEILLADERLSSHEAEEQLRHRKQAGEHLTRKRKKAQLDAVAAAVLLQRFLDGQVAAIPFTTP